MLSFPCFAQEIVDYKLKQEFKPNGEYLKFEEEIEYDTGLKTKREIEWIYYASSEIDEIIYKYFEDEVKKKHKEIKHFKDNRRVKVNYILNGKSAVILDIERVP